jgi:hypothetical protein
MSLSPGQRITLVTIDEMLALSHRHELEVRSIIDPPDLVGYHKLPRVATVRQRGKRKEQYLDLRPDVIVLDGWDLPIRVDTEGGGVFSGNACFNFVGDPDVIRKTLETRAIIPLTDDAKAKVLVWPPNRATCGDDGAVVLFPDIETHHAVVNRLKSNLRAAAALAHSDIEATPA